MFLPGSGGEVASVVFILWYYVYPISSSAHNVSVWVTVGIAAHRCMAVRNPIPTKVK